MPLETEPAGEEIKRLRRCITDLVSVLALPAMWAGQDSSRVATTSLEALVRILGLDFAYLRATDPASGSPREWMCPPEDANASDHAPGTDALSIVALDLGLPGAAVGVCVAGSRRPGFPTESDRLLLQVALNQAAIALQDAQLSEASDRLKRMADSIPEVIWITDLEPVERVIYTSPSFERVWGLRLEDLYENPRLWTETIHPDDRARVDGIFSAWVAGADVSYQDVEFRIVQPDGTIRWIHERGVLTVNAEGRPIRVSGISTDITDRKRAEDELRQAFADIQSLKEQLQRENIALREEIEQTSMFEEIVGVSEPLRKVQAQVSKVAPTDSTVLLSGETGTGKELVARAIHKRSHRASRSFVSVNCAAIPSSLIASELFGHEKGAFTGAVQRRQGRFEVASGGTIFLDEVGELPNETQIALLRVLQEREFERVGGSRPLHADVRVIAATNRDLEAAVAEKAFRADLFYRLNVFPIEIPALRDRRADIPLLVEYFTHRYATRAGKRIQGVTRETLNLLRSHHWPGNIRELQNIVERAVIVCDSDTLSIEERWLFDRVRTPRAGATATPTPTRSTLADHEKDAIEAALRDSKGRVAGPFGAAMRLGVPSTTLESKIKALRIDKRKFKSA